MKHLRALFRLPAPPAAPGEVSGLVNGRTRAGPGADRCVATVTTPSFLPGTLVALGSFLSRHPRFSTAGEDGIMNAGSKAGSAMSRGPKAAIPPHQWESCYFNAS